MGRSGSDNGNQVGGHVLLEELSCCELLLWGPVARNWHMKVRRAEKPPAGKAAELVLGGSWGIRGWVTVGWSTAEIVSGRASGESDQPLCIYL